MPKRNHFKVAAAQSLISGDVKRNGLEIDLLIRRAAKLGAKLVVFPEGALSGYAKAHVLSSEQFDHKAITTQLEILQETAREMNIWAVIGACHKIENVERPYNCQYIISNEGKLIARNDKIYLSHTELSDWYTPGEPELVTINVDGFKFGFAICIEAAIPSRFEALDELDVDCVLYSTMANTQQFETLLRGHAAAYPSWIVAAEPIQEKHQYRSMVIDPCGQILAHAAENQICIATLDRNDPQFETQLTLAKPWRQKARSGDIYKPAHLTQQPD